MSNSFTVHCDEHSSHNGALKDSCPAVDEYGIKSSYGSNITFNIVHIRGELILPIHIIGIYMDDLIYNVYVQFVHSQTCPNCGFKIQNPNQRQWRHANDIRLSFASQIEHILHIWKHKINL